MGCATKSLTVGSHKELGIRCPIRKVMPWVSQNWSRSVKGAVWLPGNEEKDVETRF
jgi:hypothetical protein